MNPFLAIGFGGMIGAGGRYGISLFFDNAIVFPYQTLIANLAGCFLLTYLMNHSFIKSRLSPETFTAITTGIIGSFTTFSTLAVETVQLWTTSTFAAISYIVITFCGGLLFSFFGYRLSKGKQVIE
ncbi:fluoride efflux transporter FluC [Oceanobacillus massiliensis]|nr:CrcB family protein [Oceanobacillus massiliensis]